jgi:hypothetical protein
LPRCPDPEGLRSDVDFLAHLTQARLRFALLQEV